MEAETSTSSAVEPTNRFTVTEKAMRPRSSARQCFYCKQPIGKVHKQDCVLVKKTVKVRMIVEYNVDVPAHWAAEQIEFHRNNGSWCSNNALSELDALFGSNNGPCLCNSARFEYIGDDSEPYLEE